jgi:glycosidase
MVPSWTENATTKFYKKLNELKHTNTALIAGQGGEFRRYQTSANKELLIYSRAQGGREIMVLLNLSDKNITYASNDALNKGGYTDYFTGAKVDNIPTSLKAWEYKVLVK